MSETDPVLVTDRDYEQVMHFMRLPKDYFNPGDQVVSVGEALSDFTTQIKDKFGVNAIALDPIYSLNPTDFNNESSSASKKLSNVFDKKDVVFQLMNNEQIIFPKEAMSASVYKMPFKDVSLDSILLSGVMEHIDLQKALPELLRVLKPSGEIRFSGTVLDAWGEPLVLFPGVIDYNERYIFGKGTHIEEGLASLVSDLDVKGYIFTTLPQKSALAKNGVYRADILAIRKDGKLPKFVPINIDDYYGNNQRFQEDIQAHKNLGKIFKIGLPETEKAREFSSKYKAPFPIAFQLEDVASNSGEEFLPPEE